MLRIPQVACALPFVLGAIACAPIQRQDSLTKLKESVDAYNHSFRWKAYGQASLHLPPDLRGPFLAAYEDEEASLQIEEARVLNVNVENDDSALVLVRYRYMMLPSVVVQKSTVTQHWKRIAGDWLLETEDNSIRDIDPAKQPTDLRESPKPKPEQEGKTEVDVFGPGDETPPDPDQPADPPQP